MSVSCYKSHESTSQLSIEQSATTISCFFALYDIKNNLVSTISIYCSIFVFGGVVQRVHIKQVLKQTNTVYYDAEHPISYKV